MVSATGGLTSGVVRTFDRLGRSETQALDIESRDLAWASVLSPEPVSLEPGQGPVHDKQAKAEHRVELDRVWSYSGLSVVVVEEGEPTHTASASRNKLPDEAPLIG